MNPTPSVYQHVIKFLNLLLLMLLTSCNLVKDVEFKGVQKISLMGVSTSEIKVKIIIEVYNPNFYKLKITEGNIKVSSKDLEIGDININNAIILPAKKSQTAELVLISPLKSLFSSKTLELYKLFKEKNISITVAGNITGKGLGLAKNIQINQTQELQL